MAKQIGHERMRTMSEAKVEKLAAQLVEFFKDTNPYEYMDSCEDTETEIRHIVSDLLTGKIDPYAKELIEFIEESDGFSEIKTATNLLNEQMPRRTHSASDPISLAHSSGIYKVQSNIYRYNCSYNYSALKEVPYERNECVGSRRKSAVLKNCSNG